MNCIFWCCCKRSIITEESLKEPLNNLSVSVRIDSVDYFPPMHEAIIVKDITREEVLPVITEIIDDLKNKIDNPS